MASAAVSKKGKAEMNHTKVLKRGWHTLWHYRALWIFGIILALVTFSWKTAALFDDDSDWERQGVTITRLPGETFPEAFRRTMQQEVDEANRELNALFAKGLGIGLRVNVLAIFAVLIGLVTIAFVVAKIARYVSETALIRMVGEYQETGERLSVWQGLRLGWSRSAGRLFLIDLLVDVLAVLAGILLFGLIFVPLPLWVNGSEGVIFTFAFLTAGLFFVAIGVVIVAATVACVLKRLARQACALEGLGVTEAIRRGGWTLWQHLKDAGLMWLIAFGLRVVWSVAMVPVVLLLVGAGLMLGGLPGIAAGGLAGLVATADAPVFVALALGISIFLLVLVGPLVLLGGLRQVFVSSLWTLTYQELQSLESSESEPLPAIGASGLEAAAA
jgi:hypothetical protein